MTRLDAAAYELGITWTTITAELIGKATLYRDEGKERCWGSIHVCRQTGAWHDWASGSSGYSSIELIRFLKKRAGETWSFEDAERWLVKFLADHPGTGQLEAADDEWTQARREAIAALCRHRLDTGEPVPPGSPGAVYRASRGLPEVPPEGMLWIANARPGEGALIMPLTAFDRVTGVVETYIDALGRKSLVLPNRRRLDLESAPGAIMQIASAVAGTIDISADVITCEGWENGESINLVKNPAWRIIALPGITTLKHLPSALKPEERRVIVFQDSDPEGHPAREGLAAGVDALFLAGKQVRVTEDADGDANKILQTKGQGEKKLKRLLAKPAGAALSFKGKIEELARLPETEYMQARREVARKHKVPAAYLDREVAKRRPKPTEAEDGSPATGLSVPEDPPFVGPIPPLNTILGAIRKQIERFVAITAAQLTTVVLWIAAAHLLHIPKLDLQLFPKLAIQSKDPASGKTTLLILIWNCLPRAKLWTFPTGAYLVRALEEAAFSLCLDELQYAEDRNLLRVINSSQHKPLAYVPLLVPDHKGAYIPHEYFVWAPMALARLGQFSTAQQSRSIMIWMMPKLRGEKRERLRRPIVPELALCRQQLAAFAGSIEEWTEPEIPAGLQNRDIDNWVPLLFVAQQAGGEWPGLATKAVEEMMKTERLPTLTERLLASIWRCFQPYPDVEPVEGFLASKELIARLIGDEEEDWDKINVGGKPITFQWLRERLANLLEPPGTQSTYPVGADGVRRHERGLSFTQFERAFARFLGGEHPSTYHPDDPHTYNPTPAGTSGAAGAAREKTKDTAKVPAPDAEPDRDHPVHEKSSKSAGLTRSEPHAPDEPDQSARVGDIHASDPFAWTRGPQPPTRPPAHVQIDLTGGADAASTPEPPKAAENLDPGTPKKARPAARPRRAKPNSVDPAARSRPAPQLDVPEPSLIDYIEGSIAEEIRQLHAANPKRSLKWIAKESGQPGSVVREILGDGEGEP